MFSNKLIEDISILIVEDEQELREYISEYVQIFFKSVYTAKCGQDGYMKYLDKHPDIIITDVYMPNLDGLSMISRIRERDKDTKIIVMSAHSEKEKLLQAVELQLVTYLIKPIKTETLKKVLHNIVDSIRASTQKVYLRDGVYWDKKSNTLWDGLDQIILKERESMLMQLLCSKLNSAFSNENIFYKLYAQSEKEFSEYAITSLVKRLRCKLPKDVIQNEYGSGYKIVTKS